MSEIRKIADKLTEKWGYKENDLSARIGKFLSQIELTEKKHEILKKIIENYTYITEEKELEILRNFNKEIRRLGIKTIVYSPIEDKKGKINSSYELIVRYKDRLKIKRIYNYKIEKIAGINVDALVSFDDVSGSGNTIVKFFKKYEWALRYCKEVKDTFEVFLFIYIITEKAEKKIREYSNIIGIKINIFYFIKSQKCFDKGVVFNDENIENREIIKRHEEEIGGKKSKFILGFEESEMILSFYNTTPNNTLSSFWLTTTKWKGLFPVEKKQPPRREIDQELLALCMKGVK